MKELHKTELIIIEGGKYVMPKLLKGGFWFTAAKFVYDHWNEIKSGAMDGWEDGGKDL